MKRNPRFWLLLFVLVAVAQLYVPIQMIWSREGVLREGTDYKFKTAPVDPSDPFRGKYVALTFEEGLAAVQHEEEWQAGQTIYLTLRTDSLGYARIDGGFLVPPANNANFLTATVSYVSDDGTNEVMVDLPFDRFYMEESKAYEAEQIYRETQRDENEPAYALVSVKDGEAVLKDVFIDGVSLAEVVRRRRGE